jgi:hypothetical protein
MLTLEAVHVGEDLKRCIRECLDCHGVCLAMMQHCLERGGRPAHIRLLLDCAEICRTGADFLLRESDLHVLTCGVCAQICERCADDCESFGDDHQMLACAQACRRCAESCREMTRR